MSQQKVCRSGFPGDSVVKNPPAKKETWVRSLDQEDPLEKKMAIHSRPGKSHEQRRLVGDRQGLQRVRHNLAIKLQERKTCRSLQTNFHPKNLQVMELSAKEVMYRQLRSRAHFGSRTEVKGLFSCRLLGIESQSYGTEAGPQTAEQLEGLCCKQRVSSQGCC